MATDAELSEWGLMREDFPDEEFPIWPDFDDSWRVFIAMRRQWNVIPAGGVMGFRLETVPAALDLEEVPPERRRLVWEDLKVMETAAIAELNGRKK